MSSLGTIYDLSDFLPFIAILISVSIGVIGLLWVLTDFPASAYYMILYVSFLGLLELATALDLRLPAPRWLNLVITLGFVGWIGSLIMYFS